MQLVAYGSTILGPQFEKYLRAEVTDTVISSWKRDDVLLVRVDPLDVELHSGTPLVFFPADKMDVLTDS